MQWHARWGFEVLVHFEANGKRLLFTSKPIQKTKKVARESGVSVFNPEHPQHVQMSLTLNSCQHVHSAPPSIDANTESRTIRPSKFQRPEHRPTLRHPSGRSDARIEETAGTGSTCPSCGAAARSAAPGPRPLLAVAALVIRVAVGHGRC